VFGAPYNVGLHGLLPYPYLFLNPTIVGTSGVIIWLGILFVVFLSIGYLFYWVDKIN